MGEGAAVNDVLAFEMFSLYSFPAYYLAAEIPLFLVFFFFFERTVLRVRNQKYGSSVHGW